MSDCTERPRDPRTGKCIKRSDPRLVPPPEPAARLVRTAEEAPRLTLPQRIWLRLGGVVRVRHG